MLGSLNEGRSVNPGYTFRPRRHRAGARFETLNEGRSVNPGYTSWDPFRLDHVLAVPIGAQRRPERQPRLHLREPRPVTYPSCVSERSTKAGASTPATPPHVSPSQAVVVRRRAQRRPERQPRLHQSIPCARSPCTSRATVAQRRPERQPRLHSHLGRPAHRRRSAAHPKQHHRTDSSLNEGRSVNPGYTLPGDSSTRRRPLNEGRSVNPGYTISFLGRSEADWLLRSTKAGASTPATPKRTPSGAITVVISAQRRPERQPRLHC